MASTLIPFLIPSALATANTIYESATEAGEQWRPMWITIPVSG
jgi:hypothetical protein